MAKLSKIAQVQQQRRKLEEEIAKLRETIAHKEQRCTELAIAERVLETLDGGTAEPAASAEVNEEARKPGWTTERRGPKPEGTPTVTEMILQVLKDAQDNLKSVRTGLEPREIAAEIAKRWWPDVTINAVGPIAWRMYKKGALTKRGSRYFPPRPVTEEPTEVTTKPAGSLFN